MNREQIAWAAGLFEGEGCFTGNTHPNDRFYAVASMSMADEDCIRAFRDVVGFGLVTGPLSKGKHKPQWAWNANTFEHTQAIYAMLYPWLKSRRRARGAEVLGKASRPRHMGAFCRSGHHRWSDGNLYMQDGRRRCRACILERIHTQREGGGLDAVS